MRKYAALKAIQRTDVETVVKRAPKAFISEVPRTFYTENRVFSRLILSFLYALFDFSIGFLGGNLVITLKVETKG
jgi:hypothetical protein